MVVAHRFSCSVASRIFPDQGSNSVSCIGRSHQGSPQSPVLLSQSFIVFARLAWRALPSKTPVRSFLPQFFCPEWNPPGPLTYLILFNGYVEYSTEWLCHVSHSLCMDTYSFWFFLYLWWTPLTSFSLCSNITSLRSTPHHSLTCTPDFIFFKDFPFITLYNFPTSACTAYCPHPSTSQ